MKARRSEVITQEQKTTTKRSTTARRQDCCKHDHRYRYCIINNVVCLGFFAKENTNETLEAIKNRSLTAPRIALQATDKQNKNKQKDKTILGDVSFQGKVGRKTHTITTKATTKQNRLSRNTFCKVRLTQITDNSQEEQIPSTFDCI